VVNKQDKSSDKYAQNYFDSASATNWYDDLEEYQERTFIKFVCSFSPPPKALDIGCGKGVFLKVISENCPNAQVFGLDISIGMLSKSFKKVPLVCGSVRLLPFNKGIFDIVHLDSVLHHLLGPKRSECYLSTEQALSELFSILRTKGYLLLAEPIYEPAFVGFIIFYIKKMVCFLTNNKRIGKIGAPIVSFYSENKIKRILSKFAEIECSTFRKWDKAFYLLPFLKRRGKLHIIAKKKH